MSKLVLDVGGSAIKWAVMDDDAAILEKGEVKTPLDSFESFMKAVVELYESKADIEGIAISLPGNIDVSTGYVYAPGALSFNANRNIVDEIHKYIKLPVSVENDGKCAALAEVWKGKLKDHKDGIVLIIGTGIGGGVVIDRKVLKGQHFFAGEFSYLITDINQPDFRSAFALNGSASALCGTYAKLKGLDPKEVNGKLVFERIKENDAEAIEALDKMTKALAVQIYNLQCAFDPELILIGGGVSKQELLLNKIKEKLDEVYGAIPPFFTIPHAQVDTCEYFNDSNLIGALYHYLNGGSINA